MEENKNIDDGNSSQNKDDLPSTVIQALGYTPLTSILTTQPLNTLLDPPQAISTTNISSATAFTEPEILESQNLIVNFNQNPNMASSLSSVVHQQPPLRYPQMTDNSANSSNLSPLAQHMLTLLNNPMEGQQATSSASNNNDNLYNSNTTATPINTNSNNHIHSYDDSNNSINDSTKTIANMKISKSTKASSSPKVNRESQSYEPIPQRKVSEVAKQSAKQKLDDAESDFFDFIERLLSESSSSLNQQPSLGKHWFNLGRPDNPSLSNVAIERLHTLLWKLDGTPALEENTGAIVELYRVLQRPLSYTQLDIAKNCANGLNLSSSSPEETDRLFKVIDNTTKTAKLVLEFYYIGRSDYALLREELFMEVLDYLASAVNKVFIPVTSMKTSAPQTREINFLLQTVNKTLKALLNFLKANDTTGSAALHKIQYMCTNIIFAQTDNSGIATEFQALAGISILLLSKVFSKADDCDVIVKEMLMQADQLPQKLVRRYPISPGVTASAPSKIHNFSALTLGLLRISGTGNFDNESDIDTISDSCISCQNQCFIYSRQVVTYLFDKAAAASATGASSHRVVLETLVEDALSVLYDPLWPSAEALVLWTVNELYQKVLKKASAKGIVLALDLLGMIANGLVKLKQCEGRVDTRYMDWNDYKALSDNFRLLLQTLKNSRMRRYIMTAHINTLKSIKLEDFDYRAEVSKVLDVQYDSSVEQNLEQSHYLTYLSNRQLNSCYDSIIGCVIQTLHANSKLKTAASKALKMLTQLAEANPNVLAFGQVQVELKNMLRDESSQVRESAISLVTRYLKEATLKSQYFDTVVDRAYNDPGLAPRKRALQALCDLYGNSDPDTKYIIIRCLLNAVNDEENSIQKLAKDNLEGYLFKEWDPNAFGDINSLIVQKARKVQVLQVAEVISKSLNEKTERLFLDFLSDIPDWVKERAGIILDVLVDELNSESNAEPYLEFISILVRANPQLITVGHLRLLRSFPVEERAASSTTKSRYYALVIFRHALKGMTTVDANFLKELKESLMKRLSAYSISEINEAVPCLWSAVVLMKSDVAITSIARAMKSSMARIKTLSQDSTKVTAVRRLAFIIGCIGRYCKLGDQLKLFDENLTTAGNKDFDVRTRSVALVGIQNLMTLLSSDNEQIQKAALQNVGQICIGNPPLFQHQAVQSLYGKLLQSRSESLKDIIMKTLTEFIELDVILADEVAKKRAAIKDEKVDISGNANNLGSSVVIEVAQKYKDTFKAVALSSENDSAYTAARLLNLIGKQGLTAPQEVASVIIALMSSGAPQIAFLAKSAFEKMFHKHEATLPSQTQQGIRLAADTRRKLVGNSLITERDRLRHIYSILHPPQAKSTTSAKKFFTSLFRATRIPSLSSSNMNQLRGYLDFVAFTVNGVSWLNILSADEVSVIIKEITEILKISSEIVDQVYSEIEPSLNPDNAIEGRETPEMGQKCVRLAPVSAALLLLWNLRKFLKQAYASVNNRLQAPKSKVEQYRCLDLTQLLDYDAVADFPTCCVYIRQFHEAMEQEFEKDTITPDISPVKRSIDTEQGVMEFDDAFVEDMGEEGTPTKKPRLDFI